MKRLQTALLLILISTACFAQDDKASAQTNKHIKAFKPIGQLGEKLGTTLTVIGIVVEGDSKGYQDGPNLKIQMINDKPTQTLIQIPVSPYFGEFGDGRTPKIKNGDTYRLRVYETGGFVGIPSEAYDEAGITLQTSGFHFQNRLIVISGEKIKAIEWAPNNFLGEYALLSGIAKNENDTAILQTSKWNLRLIGCRKWEDSEIGKLAEAYGIIQETKIKKSYTIENCEARLVKLEDQVGKNVKLRGVAISSSVGWWFNYRGTDIYVEKMDELPNWTVQNHFLSMEISGILEMAELPALDQLNWKSNAPPKKQYIVRKASWKPVTLLAPEIPEEEED